jgi:1,4-alpha-glucan branching enzyme
MMNHVRPILCALVLSLAVCAAVAQTPADSVTVTFRADEPATPVIYVPGQFNNWGPNSGGVISPGAPSTMTYDATLGSWTKTYTFKIHDPADTRRSGGYGDSSFQYKFNRGGGSSSWFADPLSPESNQADNGNSILRMTELFWFEVRTVESGSTITRIKAGLPHANDASITLVRFSTAAMQASPRASFDITGSYDEAKRTVDYTLASPIGKTDYVRLVAYSNAGDSVVYEKGGYVVVVRPLPAYVQNGVTLPTPASNDSVSFRLRVPGKQYVLVRIAPLGQPVATAPYVVMCKAPDPSNWWVNVKLAPGTYEYVYEIENNRQILDPWGRVNGTNGSRFTVGPEGLTADDYVWADGGYVRPPMNKLVTYEMNLGEFVGGYNGWPGGQAKFTDLIPLLSHFDTLGVNAIELMPVNDYGSVGQSGFSWGYDINSYMALEPGYGTPAHFKQLVDSAHAHGIAIILDAVFNHLTDASMLWQMLPDEVTNPYFKLLTDSRPNEDGTGYFRDVDHWNSETQELVLASLRMFIDSYHVDGFRYDYTQGIGWSRTEPTKGVLGWVNQINTLYGGQIYQIAEHLPESPALIYYSGITSGWHDSFRDKIFDEARYRSVSLLDFEDLVLDLGAFASNDTPSVPNRYANRTEPVNATVTHDEQSLIYEMTTFQGVGVDEAVLRDKLYATFIFASTGIPMLWQGMEFSAPRGWLNDGLKLTYRPVEWSFYSTDRGRQHFRYYQALAKQRIHNPALFDGQLRKLYRYNAQKTLVWGFSDPVSGAQIMVAANLSGSLQNITNVPWLSTGTWYDVFTQTQAEITDTVVDFINLAPYTAIVYSNKSDVELGIVTGVEDGNPSVPVVFGLSQNYPNPFNPSTRIAFDLPAASPVSLRIYDMLGREVATLVDDSRPAGHYDVVWNADRVASGVYLCRLTAGGFSEVRKMMVMH